MRLTNRTVVLTAGAAAAVAVLMAAIVPWDPLNRGAAADEWIHPFSEVSVETLAALSLRAREYTGPTDGFLHAEQVHAIASEFGGVDELVLVEVSNTPASSAENPPERGHRPLESKIFAPLRKPVWVAVMDEELARSHAEASGYEPPSSDWGYFSLLFFDARTGDWVYGTGGSVDPGWADSTGQ